MTEATTVIRSGQFKHGHWLVLGVLSIASGIMLSLHTDEAAATRPEPSDGSTLLNSSALPWARPSADYLDTGGTGKPNGIEDVFATAESPGEWQTIKVKYGDNLSAIFARLDISPQLLHTILSLGDEADSLKHIHPGQLIKLKLAEQSQLLELMYDMDPTRSLRIWQEGVNGFKSALIERPIEHRINHATGVINSSLFESGQQAGLSDKLTMELAGIFGWDIDFALDIREGDRFSVIYDDQYVGGKWLRHGDILAAEFINNGTAYRAVRYTDPNGQSDYYSPDGKSMRKAFLRTPVEFSRISSYFSTARFHPILNRIRAHKGVDYAAPIGTPVKATGDGKVVFVGRRGGYGNAIELQHGARYSTLYGHLSRFARGLHAGNRIHQGQVIGYVGMTGLATGPHLHYEFRIDGVHRNPLKVQFPDAAPIAAKYEQDFAGTSRRLQAQLDEIDGTSSMALNDR
jgi:murein DD-endopeptidase MepM/ murein hydrolase activator NlpD